MKRAGFTMIELIFVIVILGILAAVAIPKLSATRDDAKASRAATNLATYVNDIGAYYTARGTLDVTNSNVNLAQDGCFGSAKTTETSMTIDTTGANSGKQYCIQAIVLANQSSNIGVHTFGGTGVSY